MRLDKRILCTLCAVMLVGCLAYTGSLSYLQQMDVKTNKFSVGNNTSRIVETFTPPANLNQGTRINKKVQVQNQGSVSCYVRVLVLPSSNPGSFRLENTSVDSSLTGAAKWYHTGSWDNYYYYKAVLAPGETTTALFDGVTVLSNLNGLSADDAKIIVYEESVQSEGYSNCVQAFQ